MRGLRGYQCFVARHRDGIIARIVIHGSRIPSRCRHGLQNLFRIIVGLGHGDILENLVRIRFIMGVKAG